MQYYGIQTPLTNEKSYIHWISQCEQGAWDLFFQFQPHRLSLYEARRAYEAIGYKCVELSVTVVLEKDI